MVAPMKQYDPHPRPTRDGLHRSGWFVMLVCGALLWSSAACTRLRVETAPYQAPPPSASGSSTPTGGPSLDTLPVQEVRPANPGYEGDVAPDAASRPVSASPVLPQATPADAAGVSFAAYKWGTDKRNATLYEGQVLVQLWLKRGGQRELVQRSDASSWARLDLIPGDYELEVVQIYSGDQSYPPNDDNHVEFTLTAGNTAQINLVLKQVPWGAIIIVSLGVVLVVALVAVAVLTGSIPGKGKSGGSSRGSTHIAPPTPRVSHPPTVHLRGWAGPPRLYVPIELVLFNLDPIVVWPEGTDQWNPEAPPTDNLPRLVRIGVPDRLNPYGEINLDFDRPMEPFYFDPGTCRLTASDGSIVPGGVYYLEARHRAVFHPLRPLPPGKYRITVYGEMLQDTQGVSPSANLSHTFEIGP